MFDFASLIISLLAFLSSITFHEFCHALTAYLLGDDTAKRAGRLTLNPLSHIDLLGLLFLILIRIGWAKPVPFDPRNFKYPRFYSVLVGLAGPFSNLILAVLCMFLLKHIYPYISTARYGGIFLRDSIYINVMLGLFNLLPIPPLDGSHLISALLPISWRSAYARFQPFSIILLVILLNIPGFQRAFFTAINSTIAWLAHVS